MHSSKQHQSGGASEGGQPCHQPPPAFAARFLLSLSCWRALCSSSGWQARQAWRQASDEGPAAGHQALQRVQAGTTAHAMQQTQSRHTPAGCVAFLAPLPSSGPGCACCVPAATGCSFGLIGSGSTPASGSTTAWIGRKMERWGSKPASTQHCRPQQRCEQALLGVAAAAASCRSARSGRGQPPAVRRR